MKKEKILKILFAIVSIVIVVGIIVAVNMKKDDTSKSTAKNDLKFKEVANMKESEKELPDFKIDIKGAYEGILDKELLTSGGIKVYEFDAAMDNGWDIVTNHYAGVKFLDVVEIMLQDAPYTRLEIQSSKYRAKVFEEVDIDENMYLVFERDGKPIRKAGTLTMLNTDYRYAYSIEEVAMLYFVIDNLDK